MTTEERKSWLAERRQGIGGSDVAAILGVSPWNTAVGVWLDKTGRAQPKEENEAMRIGTELEDFVARRYTQETGRQVQRYNRMIHDGCFIGNYDRLVVPEGAKVASHMGEIRTDTLLECKTSSHDWDGEVPVHYMCQVLWYIGLTPRMMHADVACLFLVHKKFEVFRVERDDELIRAMREKLSAWWEEYVVGDKMPPPVNEEDCKLLWARSNPGKKVVADANVEDKLRRYLDAKATEAAGKNIAKELQGDICAFMGDAEVLTDPLGKPLLTWKSAKDSQKVDWEAVARSLATPERVAEAVAKFTVTSPGSRRFVPKTKTAA